MTDWSLADEPLTPQDVTAEGAVFEDDGIDRTSNSPLVQIVDGEVIYRASSVGGCPRKLWGARSGYPIKPPSAKMQAIFDRGHELEPIILAALRQRGWELRNLQGEVFFQVFTLPSGTTISVMGHFDCEARYPIPGQLANPTHEANWSEWYPCDVKGFGKDLVSEYLSHGTVNLQHYEVQQSIYVIGHPTAKAYLMPIWDKEKSELLQSSLYPMLPDYQLEDIANKLAAIEHAFINSEMPDCTGEYPCPFYGQLCEKKTQEAAPVPPEAIIYIIARNNADAKIKLFQTAKDAMTAELMKILPEGFHSTFEGSGISVIPNPNKFNTNKAKDTLKEAGFDIDTDEWKIPGVGYKLVIIPPK